MRDHVGGIGYASGTGSLRCRMSRPGKDARRPHSARRALSSPRAVAVDLTIRILGLELLSVSITTDTEDDTARDLSGGTLGTDRIDPGKTDRWMGFTNGREVGDDDDRSHR